MKRFLTALLALLCVFALLCGTFACTQPSDDDPSGEENVTPDDPTPEVPSVDVVKDGTSAFRIVRTDNAAFGEPIVDTAIALREAIEAATGVELTITTDWENKDDNATICEIVVGQTNREINEKIPEDLSENAFVIHFDGTKLLIAGNNDLATQRAVEYFIATYLGYNEADGSYSAHALSLPETLEYQGKFDAPPTVYLIRDIRYIGAATNNEDFNDTVRLYTALQGRLNKNAEENNFYIYQMYDKQDQFWLDYLCGEGKMFENARMVDLTTWDELWAALGSYVTSAGLVVWDPEVPATSNVAATICSVEGYLPVRYDPDADSMYSWLLDHGVAVKMDLCNMFDGKLGTKIADTDIDSTGSIKCDPYLWAMEKYMDRCNSAMLAYALDGASAVATNTIYQTAESNAPNYNQLYSHDYYIYNECFFIDLTCVADEIPCDDPDQPMGTDAETLALILQTMEERNAGNMSKLMGFPPWYMKYTTFRDHGKTEPVALEWAFVDFISEYNFIKEADAAHPSWMTNASVYCQYELEKKNYQNTVSPLVEIFDENTRYFTIYIGDYDSSAWLKNMVPDLFTSPDRGKIPMMWAFNPNLSDRVPMIFDYIYESATENDYFVTGDSGAGYVFPSSVPDIDLWVEYNLPYMDRFDMSIVGFIINGTQPLTVREFAAYAEIAPVGSFHNDHSQLLTVYNGETVYMTLQNQINPGTAECNKDMMNWMKHMGSYGYNFGAFRTIVQGTTTIVNCVEDFIEYAESQNDGYEYVYVDMYTLFDLVLQSGQGNYIFD